uniref:Uncharacterized protein n=1 Tax=Vombatus ursinus TaxID=29139 RepID=A0A4X2L4U7_VOMUR
MPKPNLLKELLWLPIALRKICKLVSLVFQVFLSLAVILENVWEDKNRDRRGTRVSKHCTTPHTLGICERCPPGEYSLKNGLDTCRQCTQCREDQVMLGPCFGGIDTKCQCKEQYYCEAPDCEICQRCTERCPEGTQILQKCNATADTLCGVPGSGFTSRGDSPTVPESPSNVVGMPVPWVLLGIGIGIGVVCWVYRCYRNRQRSLGVDGRKALDESTSSILIEEAHGRASTVPESSSPSREEQFSKDYALQDVTEAGKSRSFYIFQRHLHKHWNEFVRNLGLEENEIATAVQQHPSNPEEQKFQMLLTWWNKLGRAASVFKLLATAHKMPMITLQVQNILNDLINEGILCKQEDT